MNEESAIDKMVCKNCNEFENNKCKSRNEDVKPEDTCSEFDECYDNIQVDELLKNPNLFDIITEQELDKKIVGEVETRKVIFLCACGIFVENHETASYNLLVNDDAGVGKDYVTGATLEIFPKEKYIHKTRISPTVFTYWHNPKYEPEWTWNGKIFYPEDISQSVLNSDVFKVMTSKGSSATIVIKQKAIEIDIAGKPVMITTTATATPNPELTRRFVILNLDSSEEQTREIMKRYSEYRKNGIVPRYDEKYTKALSKLKRIKVKIPFSDLIDKHFPHKNIIMRTNYPRFLDFISASTGFHQFQRKKDTDGYFLSEEQDYNIARDCFLKLCSNKYMIPLTINQKKILEFFEKKIQLKGSAKDLYNIGLKFITEKSIRYNCKILTKYGILEVENEKDSFGNEKEVFFISKAYKPNERIKIPIFEELTSIPSMPSIPSEPSEPSEPIGMEAKEGSEARNCKNNPSKQDIFNGKPPIEYKKV